MPRLNPEHKNPPYATIRKRVNRQTGKLEDTYVIRMVINGKRHIRFAHSHEQYKLVFAALTNEKNLGTIGEEINNRDKLKRTTVGQLVEIYRNSIFFLQKKSSDTEVFKMDKVLERTKWEHILLSGFGRNDIRQYRDERLKEGEGVSIEAIKRELNPFQHMFSIADTEFQIPVRNDLFRGLYDHFKDPVPRDQYLEPHMIGKLLLAYKKHQGSKYRSAEEMTKLWQCLI